MKICNNIIQLTVWFAVTVPSGVGERLIEPVKTDRRDEIEDGSASASVESVVSNRVAVDDAESGSGVNVSDDIEEISPWFRDDTEDISFEINVPDSVGGGLS